jgi:Transposase and inactivated derivatives
LNLSLDYGRSPQGERVYGEKSVSKGQRISTIGALSTQCLATALCFEGTLTGAVFLFFLKHFFCPLLKPEQVVVLDNASAHKGEGVVERIEKTGARALYLPPYSPDLTPIELAWSKVKQGASASRRRAPEKRFMMPWLKHWTRSR